MRRCLRDGVHLLVIGLAVLTTPASLSCSESDCAATATCRDDAPPPGCDPDADAKDATPCADESYALFVDPEAGDDSGPGSRSRPLRTLAAATNVDRLARRPRVYVCNRGVVAESVELPPNVSLMGGFDCGGWTYSGAPTRITPNDGGIGLRIASSTKRVVVSDIAVKAMDAEGDGASSIAILIAESKVLLRRVSAEAGRGANGVTPSTPSNHASTHPDGNAATSTIGASAKRCQCANVGATSGGRGGNASAAGEPGSVEPFVAGMAGMPGSGGASCMPGSSGGNSKNGGEGGRRSAVLGTLTADGWTPGRGGDGAAGGAGAGGGGGGGDGALGGGGGACGGCGGNGGFGGGGGGASMALAMLMSDVTLEGGSYTSALAGDGASGGTGEVGAAGGKGGGGACSGGDGGEGAGGGGGAGGAGGVSAAIVLVGGVIQRGEARLVSGKSGARGAGGLFGVGAQVGAGGEGGLELTEARAVLEL